MKDETQNLVIKAEALIEIERYREAVPLLGKALADDPQDTYAACLMAQCFFELGESAKALEFAEKAIQIEPEYEWGHRLRSFALGALGKKKESLQSAQEALRLAPEEPFVLMVLINAMVEQGKAEESRPFVDKLLELSPDSENAHLAAGNVYLAMEYYHSAEKHFREALRINPTSYNAQNNLGVVALRRDGKIPDAVEYFSSAVKLNPVGELAADNLKLQFSVMPQMAVFVVLFPFAVMGILVAPIVSIIFILGGLFQIIKVFVVNAKNRRQLAKEFQMLFKSESYKQRADRSGRVFGQFIKVLFMKIKYAYALAVIALGLQLCANKIDSNVLDIAAFLIFIGATIMIGNKLNNQ